MKVNELIPQTDFAEAPPHVNELQRFLRVLVGRKIVVFGLVVIALLVIAAIFAPLLAPYDPYKISSEERALGPSSKHLLGTDIQGRDTLSRIIYGSRTALMVGVIAVGISASVGITLGLIAGYFGGWIYVIIMRFIDALMSFPMILLALVIAAILGSGLKNVIIAVGVALTPGYARMMCGMVLSTKESDYIIASHAVGASNLRVMLRHLLPNCFPPLLVLITMLMGRAILAEAGLSFLGIGIEVPGAAWGSMVSDGYRYLLDNPVLSIAPGVAIILVVFSFNMLGDGLRDALDPRLRGTL